MTGPIAGAGHDSNEELSEHFQFDSSSGEPGEFVAGTVS
jgi:hypothetical protein